MPINIAANKKTLNILQYWDIKETVAILKRNKKKDTNQVK
jgi:hypothetical protein